MCNQLFSPPNWSLVKSRVFFPSFLLSQLVPYIAQHSDLVVLCGAIMLLLGNVVSSPFFPFHLLITALVPIAAWRRSLATNKPMRLSGQFISRSTACCEFDSEFGRHTAFLSS